VCRARASLHTSTYPSFSSGSMLAAPPSIRSCIPCRCYGRSWSVSSTLSMYATPSCLHSQQLLGSSLAAATTRGVVVAHAVGCAAGGWTRARSAPGPHVISRSLTLFHHAILEQASDNPTAAFVVDPAADDMSSPFFGSEFYHGRAGCKQGLSSALAQAQLEQLKPLKQRSPYTEFCSSSPRLSSCSNSTSEYIRPTVLIYSFESILSGLIRFKHRGPSRHSLLK
jgi:hypothetical protein